MNPHIANSFTNNIFLDLNEQETRRIEEQGELTVSPVRPFTELELSLIDEGFHLNQQWGTKIIRLDRNILLKNYKTQEQYIAYDDEPRFLIEIFDLRMLPKGITYPWEVSASIPTTKLSYYIDPVYGWYDAYDEKRKLNPQVISEIADELDIPFEDALENHIEKMLVIQ